MSKLETWGVLGDVIELQGQGVGGKPAARAVMPKIEETCARLNLPVPSVEAVGMAIKRYFENPASDGRTRRARSQKEVAAVRQERAAEVADRQVDAIASLERQFLWVQEKGAQVDTILARLEELAKKDDAGGITTSNVRDAAVAFKAFSSEQRGWLELLVDVKDRLYVHQQYEQAFREILAAIMAEAPDRAPAIANRLRTNPVVANVLRMRAAAAGEVA